MSDPGTPIPVLWFDSEGCGPSELALQLHPFAAMENGAIPANLGLRIRAATDPNGGALVYGSASILPDSGFLLDREQVVDLTRQLAEWLRLLLDRLIASGVAQPPESHPGPPTAQRPVVVNLATLAAERAKMTLGTKLIECCADQPESHPCRLVWIDENTPGFSLGRLDDGERASRSDVHGIVATHNAADVLIELARAAKRLDAARHAWDGYGYGNEATAEQTATWMVDMRKAEAEYDAALAKVSL